MSAKTADVWKRLFSLFANIMEMVVADKRSAEEVADVLQVIKSDKYFSLTLGRKTMCWPVKKQLDAWTKLYLEEFGIILDTSEIKIPIHQDGWNRLIVVARGLTSEKIYQAMKKMMPAWKKWNNLDSVESIRKADKTYVVWVRDRVEADEELKNNSANALKEKGVNCITIEERLLLEMKYFMETGKSLDIQNWTLCAGSRRADGCVPIVRRAGGEICVDGCNQGYTSEALLSRSVVS